MSVNVYGFQEKASTNLVLIEQLFFDQQELASIKRIFQFYYSRNYIHIKIYRELSDPSWITLILNKKKTATRFQQIKSFDSLILEKASFWEMFSLCAVKE